MATEAQIRANRINAQRSSGPRTEAGKQACKYNALTHGLAASKLVLNEESAADLEALRAQLHADYSPVDETERMLVQEMAQCWFRLQRARTHEVESLNLGFQTGVIYNAVFNGILRYSNAAERGFHRAIKALRTVQAERQIAAAEATNHGRNPSRHRNPLKSRMLWPLGPFCRAAKPSQLRRPF